LASCLCCIFFFLSIQTSLFVEIELEDMATIKKKVDSRIKTLIENGVKTHHRSFFVIVGDKARDQIVNLHYMLSKASVKARPSVLWCYKRDLGFSSAKQKRMKDIKKQIQKGLYDPDKDDPFELFVSSTSIRYSYYHETHKILGNTFGMCILQVREINTNSLLHSIFPLIFSFHKHLLFSFFVLLVTFSIIITFFFPHEGLRSHHTQSSCKNDRNSRRRRSSHPVVAHHVFT
jgi:hypothetical protein